MTRNPPNLKDPAGWKDGRWDTDDYENAITDEYVTSWVFKKLRDSGHVHKIEQHGNTLVVVFYSSVGIRAQQGVVDSATEIGECSVSHLEGKKVAIIDCFA